MTQPNLQGLAGGGGLAYGQGNFNLNVDYAYKYMGVLGPTHFLSFGLGWSSLNSYDGGGPRARLGLVEMWKIVLVAGLTAPMVAGPSHVVAQESAGVVVRAFRSYQAEGRQTLVQALVEVPYRLLEAAADRENGELNYGVAVQVSDASGAALFQTAWAGGGTTALRARGATKLEILDFAVPPGEYHLGVLVTDSVSGREHKATLFYIGRRKFFVQLGMSVFFLSS